MKTSMSARAASDKDLQYRASREKNEMSLCMAYIASKALYLAADSRSSFVQKKNKISDMPCKMGIITDDFKKIFKINYFNVYGFSTGQNTYSFRCNYCSLPEIIPYLDFSGCKTLWDISFLIWNSLKSLVVNNEDPTRLRLFQYIEDDLYSSEIDFGQSDKLAITVNAHIQPVDDMNYTYIIDGSPWLNAIHNSYDFPCFADDEMHIIEFIEKYFSDMKKISDIICGGIGEATRILKVTSTESKWISGEYQL